MTVKNPVTVKNAATEKNADSTPQSCLIAAHDPWIIQLLRIYSEESGFQVVQAFEGQDVLTTIQKEHPAVILLEYDLPGHIKGGEVLRKLKEDASFQPIPILVFAWQEQGMDRDTYAETVAYLQEPVTYDAFVEALKKVGICCPKGARVFETAPNHSLPQNPPAAHNKSRKRR